MKLVSNAGRITLKSYSMWGQYLAFGTLVVPAVLWYFFGIETNPYMWGVLCCVFTAFGIIGRIIDQGLHEKGDLGKFRIPLVVLLAVLAIVFAMGMSFFQRDDQSATVPAEPSTTQAFLEVAVPLVAKWEGEVRCKDDPSMHCAYLDRIARPPVWTIGYGQTNGVKAGMRWTDAEAKKDLAQGILAYRQALHRYFTDETKAQRLPVTRDAAYSDLAWNVGVGGAGGSTATKRLNAGDIAGGCDALTWWNKAGGKVIRGLVNRRQNEYEFCMIGVS